MEEYMKIGRNELCPCGSGLKYKKCCLNKEKDEEIDLYQGLVNMHSFGLRNKEHIKKYRKIRKIHSSIIDSMVKDIESNKISLDMSTYVKEAEGFVGSKLEFKKENYENVINYYGIYMFGKEGLASIYLANNRYEDNLKIDILNSMVNAYIGLFKINDIDSRNGYVYLEDVVNGKEFRVVDQSLSLNKDAIGRVYIYSRIMEIDDIAYNNCAMPIYIDNKYVSKYITMCKRKNYHDTTKSIILYYIACNCLKNMDFRTFEVR